MKKKGTGLEKKKTKLMCYNKKQKDYLKFFVIPVVTQILTHLFDKFLKNPKIEKSNENPKKYVFNIFASFLAFSTSSKKEFKLLNVFQTCLPFHVSFLKSLIFFNESTFILLIF